MKFFHRFFEIFREVEMAHKVLSKDMKELVASMQRAQQYSDTTLDVECRKYVFVIKIILFLSFFILFRNMLSSAHILAMDTKNLLDVVDSIRIRSHYPNIAYSSVTPIEQQQKQFELPHKTNNTQEYQPTSTAYNVEHFECYANMHENAQQLYSNQPECGIHENFRDSIEPLQIVEESGELYSNTAENSFNRDENGSNGASDTTAQIVQNNYSASQKVISN